MRRDAVEASWRWLMPILEREPARAPEITPHKLREE
jgi:glucose-6-phosphate 1-dehydrogenase